MEDKKINRWLRRQFSPLGWTLLAYYLILNLMVIAVMLADALARGLKGLLMGDMLGAVDPQALMGNAWGYILAVAVGAIILYGWKGSDWTWSLRVRNQRMKPGVFFALVALLGGAQMANSLWMAALEAALNLFDRSALEMVEAVTGDSDTVSMFSTRCCWRRCLRNFCSGAWYSLRCVPGASGFPFFALPFSSPCSTAISSRLPMLFLRA